MAKQSHKPTRREARKMRTQQIIFAIIAGIIILTWIIGLIAQ